MGKGRADNVWDTSAIENCVSSFKTERIARKTYWARDQAKADVFDYRCYNLKRRHSTIDYMSSMVFEMKAGLA